MLGAGKTPRIVPIEPSFVSAFFFFPPNFCLFCVANKHLVPKLRERPGLSACRAPAPARLAGERRRGRAGANRCCLSPGRGPGRGKSSWRPLDSWPAAVPTELLAGLDSREPATGASHRGPRERRAEEGAGAAAAVAAATWAGGGV